MIAANDSGIGKGPIYRLVLHTPTSTLQSATSRSNLTCSTLSGYGVPTAFVCHTVQRALRRQPDELGRAKPQRRGQRVVLRLLGDHRVLEACARSKRPVWQASQNISTEAGRGWPRLAEAGRGWPRLEAALRVTWHWRGVLQDASNDASGRLFFSQRRATGGPLGARSWRCGGLGARTYSLGPRS